MSTGALFPGSVFAGRYRVERSIAQGGMGAVYEVTHTETHRRHALKIMHAHILTSAELRERFRQEARVAASVQSEFIVDVSDAGVDAATNLPFLVMELLQGEELGRMVDERGRLSAAETVTYLGQVAMALDKTHRAMIVHRDLKPENLFLTHRDDGSPRVKVLDFGVAKIVAETSTNAAATRSVGTPLYMAPEQFQPGNRVSPSTDLFALAMIAYTFLVGTSYWEEEANAAANVFSFAMSASRGPVEPASVRARRRGVALPPSFDAWFARAASVDPSARFTQATPMIRALGEALGVPVPFRAPVGDPLSGSGSNPALSLPSLPAARPPLPSQPLPNLSLPGQALPAIPTLQIPAPAAPPPSFGGPVSAPPAQLSAHQVQPVFAPPMAATLPSPPAQDQATAPTLAVSNRAPTGIAAELSLSAAPTVVGSSGSFAPGPAGASISGAPAAAGSGKKILWGAIASFAVGLIVAVIVLLPTSGQTGSEVGAGAGPSVTATAAPPPSATDSPSPAAEIPSAAPSAAPSADPSATAAPSASGAPSSAPTATPGVRPKPKTPKPPGTSVYIRD